VGCGVARRNGNTVLAGRRITHFPALWARWTGAAAEGGARAVALWRPPGRDEPGLRTSVDRKLDGDIVHSLPLAALPGAALPWECTGGGGGGVCLGKSAAKTVSGICRTALWRLQNQPRLPKMRSVGARC
jgi:hypothetical protein